jgi:hypothetical protein
MEVRTLPCSIQNFRAFPAINIYVKNKMDIPVFGVKDYEIHHDSFLTFDCFLNAGNDYALSQESILEDIQNLFGAQYWIPDDAGKFHTTNSMYSGCQPFGCDVNLPMCGTSIYYKFDRHYYVGDPEEEAL